MGRNTDMLLCNEEKNFSVYWCLDGDKIFITSKGVCTILAFLEIPRSYKIAPVILTEEEFEEEPMGRSIYNQAGEEIACYDPGVCIVVPLGNCYAWFPVPDGVTIAVYSETA